MRTVTVVIPVHNGLEETLACLESCAAHIDARHRVLVIDDASRSDVVEAVKQAVERMPNARFIRNETNLGFVKTCNRAVLELDGTDNDILLLNADTVVTEGSLEEMLDVLYASDRHAACSPRSDQATLCTVPLRSGRDFSPEESFACWQRLKASLPRFTVAPTAVGFCMLLKRTLIRRFGLFDEAYGKGYHEENDWCFRLNRMGYSSVVAHHAFVFHKGWHAFGRDAYPALDQNNRHLLLKRYPEFAPGAARYFDYLPCAADHFGDVLGGAYPRPQLLYDLSHLTAAYNGTTEYALKLLEHLLPVLADWCEVTVLTSRRCDAFFGLSKRFPHVATVEGGVNRRFDLAFTPHQIASPYHLWTLNGLAPRLAANMQDIITLRTQKLREHDAEFAAILTMRHADGILSVSESSLNDVKAFFAAELSRRPALPMQAVLHGMDREGERNEDAPPFDRPFVLLVGNAFEHKAVSRALDHLPADLPVAVLGGARHTTRESALRKCFVSGKTPDSTVRSLYRNCSAVVFPSQYEGFGLPLLHAARCGKPVIACDLETTREVRDAFGLENYVLTFAAFDELPELVREALAMPAPGPAAVRRTWDDAARETAAFLRSLVEAPVDIPRLEERWARITMVTSTQHEYAKRTSTLRGAHQWLASTAGRRLNRFPKTKRHLTRAAAVLRLLP